MNEIPFYIDIGGDRRLSTDHQEPATGDHFFSAWEWPSGEGTILVNIEKARKSQRNSIRQEREFRWPDADSTWFKAQESGDVLAIASAVAIKQALRDAPDHVSITNAQTPEELIAITLDTILVP